jgi:hypothetical protein
MKQIIALLAFCLTSVLLKAQETFSVKIDPLIKSEPVKPGQLNMNAPFTLYDSTKAVICKERGHVWTARNYFVTSLNQPHIQDDKDTTFRVTPGVATTYTCERCRKDSTYQSEKKEILWVRKH